jgi:hypothetical protein
VCIQSIPKVHENSVRIFQCKSKERDDILETKIWKEYIHEISNSNGLRVVNFAT